MKTKLILAAAFAFAVGAGARAASPKTPVVKKTLRLRDIPE